MADRLLDRTAVVTAAASGMGREAARLFAREGAHVVLIDLDATANETAAAGIREDGGSAEAVSIDLTDSAQIRSAFEELESRHERIEVLFNHAGRPGAPAFDYSEDDWARTVDLNLKTPVFVTQLALPLLRKAERGTASIIFTSSVSGLVASPASPIYSAVKGGVVLFMKAVAVALGPEGIRANAICPGPTDTPMLRQFMGGDGVSEEELSERVATFATRFVPLQRAATPADIASVALFLASDESSYVTGVAIPVDGGFVAR